MTAFTRRERQGDWGKLTMELRSVNHRYLEVSLRMPEDLRALEGSMRQRMSERLARGKVDCHLRFESPGAAVTALTVDTELARRVARASRELEALLHNPAPVSSFDLLRWPGVLQAPEADLERVAAETQALLQEALDELIATREREGATLQAVIEQRLTAIGEVVGRVRAVLPDIQQRWRDKLRERLQELQGQLDEDRIEQEMVVLAQRMDVTEELDRLQVHVEEVRRVLQDRGPIGRRLDFLMQELNREANTLGAKSVATDSTRASVDLKVLIEQMREQIQNIE